VLDSWLPADLAGRHSLASAEHQVAVFKTLSPMRPALTFEYLDRGPGTTFGLLPESISGANVNAMSPTTGPALLEEFRPSSNT